MRTVVCYKPDTGKARYFKSAFAAARQLGLDPITVSHAAAGTHGMRHYGGLRFWYTSGVPQGSGLAIRLTSASGDVLEFPSIKTAARHIAAALGSKPVTVMSNLCQVVRGVGGGGRRYSCYGFTIEQIGHTYNPTFSGYTHTAETKARMSAAKQQKKRAVVAFDDDDDEVFRFESVSAAVKFFRPRYSRPSLGNISCALRGAQTYAYGLRWRYA